MAPAAADGDPGSDVLVYQPLFLASDAGISVSEQVKLGGLLQDAQRAGFPIRVAIISSPSDLGAVTALWQKPQTYAHFLGIELSLTYIGRLLVVMPNGFGFNWPGHSSAAADHILGRLRIGAGGAGLASATQAAVGALATAGGVKLPATSGAQPAAASQSGSAASQAPQPASSNSEPAASGSSTDSLVAIIVAGLAVLAGLGYLIRRQLARLPRPRLRRLRTGPVLGLSAGVTLLALVAIGVLIVHGLTSPAQSDALANNPYLDPGTPLTRVAPTFTLNDQFGRSVSLSSYRGKVVLLAFNDSECTTICPLTTTAMLDAKAMLGRAGDQVQLLGIDANPKSTSIEDVFSYSQLHGMLTAWHFLTGSLPQLQRVWKAYGIEAAIQAGEVAHTPALFVIDPQGHERRLYITQQSYAAVGQLGQLLAQEASQLLPSHPAVNSHLSYTQISGIAPTAPVTVPRAGGGSLNLGPGRARVYAFFATWDQEILGLAPGLEGLSGYAAVAHRLGLPPLEAVDEGSVEPPGALSRFLANLPRPLSYPVGIDRDGRLADGYEVEGLPWLMVVSKTGRIAWYYSVAVARLAQYQDAHRARPRSARLCRPGAGHGRGGPGPASRLAACPHGVAQAGRPGARVRAGARRPRPGAAGVSGRDQRLGVVVRAVPIGVRPVRVGVGQLRAAGGVPRRRYQRLGRRRAIVPGPAPGQLSELRDQHQQHDQHHPPRGWGPTDHDLHQPRRQARLRPYRSIRLPRHARRRRRDLRPRRLSRSRPRPTSPCRITRHSPPRPR